jgi:predicted nuclease of predicted toxin-antitoxin system
MASGSKFNIAGKRAMAGCWWSAGIHQEHWQRSPARSAIVYATAAAQQAELVTSDADFADLAGMTYLAEL